MTPTTDAPLLTGAIWAPDGTLVLSDRAQLEKLRRKRMSISVASTLEQCPASFVKRLLPQKADPFGARELGIESHEILDVFYQLPGASRTQAAMHQAVENRADTVWSSDNVNQRIDREALYTDELTADPDYDIPARTARDRARWIETVYGGLLGVFSLETPADVEVEATERRIFTSVEGVPITVTVDRILRLPDGTVIVDDWKFASESKLNPRDDSRDEYADQGRVYAKAIEQELGDKVSQMRLIFPGLVGKTVNSETGRSYRDVPLGEAETEESTTFLVESWESLNTMVDEGRFPAKPSVLCGWCPLVNSCPSAVLIGKKAQAHAPTQWSAAQLGIPRGDDPQLSVEHPAEEPESDQYEERREDPRMEVASLTPVGRNGEIMSMPVSNVTPLRRAVPSAAPYLEHVAPSHPGADEITNLGSYAVQSAFSLTGLALRHLNALDAPIGEQSLAALAETFAMIVADVQYELVNTTSLQHGLNPRLRGVLAGALDVSPFPVGRPVDEIERWVISTKTTLWVTARHAIDLHARQDNVRHSTAYTALAAV